ncbi:MAG TPA: hypothetical protein VF450_22015 [Noviherbaspirillum sp.]
MPFQVGRLIQDFSAADPVMDDEQTAIKAAVTASEKDWRNSFGVWSSQEEGSELLYIAHDGGVFKRLP